MPFLHPAPYTTVSQPDPVRPVPRVRRQLGRPRARGSRGLLSGARCPQTPVARYRSLPAPATARCAHSHQSSDRPLDTQSQHPIHPRNTSVDHVVGDRRTRHAQLEVEHELRGPSRGDRRLLLPSSPGPRPPPPTPMHHLPPDTCIIGIICYLLPAACCPRQASKRGERGARRAWRTARAKMMPKGRRRRRRGRLRLLRSPPPPGDASGSSDVRLVVRAPRPCLPPAGPCLSSAAA